MRFTTLPEWLGWLETLHPVKIDLGLTRVAAVASKLGLLRPARFVITVAGTNGKGSSVTMLESILMHAGYLCGTYTSPHLHRFNERIRIDGTEADDQQIMAAFDAIDRGRDGISLSYFEFSTLAALWLFKRHVVDVAVLEVGLGGRLDAVNVIDADVALLTSVGLDHTEWLGVSRAEIALEKVAVARPHRPLICGESDVPEEVIDYALKNRVDLYLAGRDYDFSIDADQWCWHDADRRYNALPLPALEGAHQVQNAAAIIKVLHSLPSLRFGRAEIEQGLKGARLAGRVERVEGRFTVVLDVSHNPHGMVRLVAALRARPCRGKNVIVFGVMADKDVDELIVQLADISKHWIAVAPAIGRAMTAEELVQRLKKLCPDAVVASADSVSRGIAFAQELLEPEDCLIVTGSFYTVAEARPLLL